eukprot:m.16388 g.16388  ORF g.16388 m.16388 type:complete len:340 (-) comp5248_c1_seq1:52-1071(-)
MKQHAFGQRSGGHAKVSDSDTSERPPKLGTRRLAVKGSELRQGIYLRRDIMGASRWPQPYYIFNAILACLFPLARLGPLRHVLFPGVGDGGFDNREVEILVFLGVIVAIKSRRVTTTDGFMATLFTFSQLTSCVLFFRLDKLYGGLYCALCIISFLAVPLREYSGDSKIIRLVPQRLENLLVEDKTSGQDKYMLLELYATWSPPCVHLARDLSDLSLKYARDHLRFAKLDVGHYKHLAEKYNVSVEVTSKQLPTLILFKNGEELVRRPFAEGNRVIPCRFHADFIIQQFDLEALSRGDWDGMTGPAGETANTDGATTAAAGGSQQTKSKGRRRQKAKAD